MSCSFPGRCAIFSGVTAPLETRSNDDAAESLSLARMPRRWLGAACGAAAAAAALAGTPTARGDEALPALRIACPELTDDDHAALEARARADLSVEPPRDGAVLIDCRARRVALEGHAPLERHVTTDVSGVALVDELLDALHLLLSERRADDAPPNAVVADLPDPRPTALAGAPQPDSQDSRLARQSDAFYRVAAAGGIDAELWSGAIGFAIGGHVGARIATRTRWATELDGGVLWGLGSTHTIEAHALRATLRADYAPVATLRIGLGADARLLVATAHSPTFPTKLDGATIGAIVMARCALRVGRFEFLVGPQAEIFVRPVVVQFNQSEALRIPTLLAGLSLEAAADLTQ